MNGWLGRCKKEKNTTIVVIILLLLYGCFACMYGYHMCVMQTEGIRSPQWSYRQLSHHVGARK